VFVRRSFHVQLYNTDSLLACALPYHDTNVFVRVLQLLKIKDATSRWNWLQCLQVWPRPHQPVLMIIGPNVTVFFFCCC